MTLSQITQAFKSLSEEHKLLLLDHLGEHTEYCDEITTGLREAAIAYGRGNASMDDEGDEAEAIADGIVLAPIWHPDAFWKVHAAKRATALQHALSVAKVAT